MLIDASHPEETRVVVVRGNRVEEFDFESASKRQLRGNIYLAKVMRVEPSLQAAFVDYGGNRHGFLAFSEIHPDYYQIPVADRRALIEEELRAEGDEEEDVARPQRRSRRHRRSDDLEPRAGKRREADPVLTETAPADLTAGVEGLVQPDAASEDLQKEVAEDEGQAVADAAMRLDPGAAAVQDEMTVPSAGVLPGSPDQIAAITADPAVRPSADLPPDQSSQAEAEHANELPPAEASKAEGELAESSVTGDNIEIMQPDWAMAAPGGANGGTNGESEEESAEIEQLGGDAMEEVPVRPPRPRRQYKIQEVIKRRQVLLVQVVKEERGNKGAALTTYLSLAGRYSVLMPNTARGGGISRKITDPADRRRLKSIAQELEVPEGMGVIVRTAGASRTKAELKRDFEYLMRMWETVRETTLRSSAPTLVYEEGSLIKRSIRDLYNKDIAEITVAGDEGYREAKEFMRLLMPSHAKMVQPYRDRTPMFAKFGVESQLDAMFSNQVTLKSGGYIVINQTEALVAIDVNSGRSTREHNIEDTALRTNLEAADEISRQLRLRDLAGLIVVDFIDMEESRNNRTVERRLKDALKNDRARIQIGRLSHFGLLEMSRQRMRAGVIEGSTVICPHCGGAGTVRSTASIALHVLRALEDALIKSSEYDLNVKTRTAVALYILNQKRAHLRELENQFGVSLSIGADDTLTNTTYYAFQRGEPAAGAKEPLPALQTETPQTGPAEESISVPGENEAVAAELPDETEASAAGEPSEGETEAAFQQRRRRRRRRGRGSDREGSGIAATAPQPPDDALEAMAKLTELTRVAAPPAAVAADTEPPFDSGEFGTVTGGQPRAGPNPPSAMGGNDDSDAASTVWIQIASEPGAGGSSSGAHNGETAAAGEKHQRSRRGSRAGLRLGSRKGAVPAAIPEPEAKEQAQASEIPIPIHVADGNVAAAASESGESKPAGLPAGTDEANAQAQERSTPAEEPPPPKRSGWWQRARPGWRG